MVKLSVVCSRCGKRMQRVVDLDCMPSGLRCACGAYFPLRVEQDPSRSSFPDGIDLENEEAAQAWIDALAEPHDMSVPVYRSHRFRE